MITASSNARVYFNKIVFLEGILFFAAIVTLGSQESFPGEFPNLWERPVVMHIVSRIVGQDQQVVWNTENTRVTFSRHPVGLRLVGSDLVVTVQFTPFLRPDGRHTLVAQGQIWINLPEQGISHHTTMQTIPLEFQEQIYFFPLGSIRAGDEAHIEIQLVLEPYSDEIHGSLQEIPNENQGFLQSVPENRGRGRGRIFPR
jgi:hypothetical protein